MSEDGDESSEDVLKEFRMNPCIKKMSGKSQCKEQPNRSDGGDDDRRQQMTSFSSSEENVRNLSADINGPVSNSSRSISAHFDAKAVKAEDDADDRIADNEGQDEEDRLMEADGNEAISDMKAHADGEEADAADVDLLGGSNHIGW
eukprot:CAMPEP_0114492522 /NCGR_PEP_ID=MMETSP0109-20121206/3597_1 /TAXON_ID=29199 /ORGANISM="Chlorarachnion reptans, Strain CCCM449" /LENGTH=145 /DNA_ID=CAMNT_0001669365 /DNA_START=197 /DNA_END=631 /DNA_ORIENTATION=-